MVNKIFIDKVINKALRFCSISAFFLILVVCHKSLIVCCEEICETVCRPLKRLSGTSAAGERYKQRREDRSRDRRREDEMAAEQRETKHAIKMERRKRDLNRLQTRNQELGLDSTVIVSEQPSRPKRSWIPFKRPRSTTPPVSVARLPLIYTSTAYLQIFLALLRIRNSCSYPTARGDCQPRDYRT